MAARGLSRKSAAARLLRLWVRIPLGTWMSVPYECCVLWGEGLYDELNHSSKGVLPTVVCHCVWSRVLKTGEAIVRVGPQSHKKFMLGFWCAFSGMPQHAAMYLISEAFSQIGTYSLRFQILSFCVSYSIGLGEMCGVVADSLLQSCVLSQSSWTVSFFWLSKGVLLVS